MDQGARGITAGTMTYGAREVINFSVWVVGTHWPAPTDVLKT